MISKYRKPIMLAMLTAIAFVAVAVGRIPVVMFLSYEPKDVIITIAGFIFGPLSALMVSLVASLIEMVTISATGIIGCVMNIVSSASFACVAALVYKKKRSLKGAVMGLALGCLSMTAVMLLWNYLITPLYMGYPREAVAAMLVPVFLPFNLLKSALNTAITLLLYRPVVTALRKLNLIEPSAQKPQKSTHVGMYVFGGLLFITCVLLILVWRGII